ncbi:tetraacyldisaccharide 4'-kinase [Rhodobacteraceae bacterium RKSG542]|uniref:tetraacyldisaccharide 4'-kinase n=1 Tax=Pseudovibrio flavus TaxID=2529854 RepID=UPI0012BD60C6|nr:tetraacyldisaccharide 4'-kinase [Pseudovibrio flavus]MTI18637.1 tetraacyldisaccharide 4'-kinase [Pseudovibrio flavus]
MKAPDFWWTPKLEWQSALLAPVGAVYGFVSAFRMARPARYSSKLPVICIGNFTVGGTGKTPFAIALFQQMKERGYKPSFLLRGYGGTIRGPVRVDPDKHRAELVGDEAMLLARVGPTVVCADRPAGAKLLESQEDVDLILMDDGFQNPSLRKDFSIVLVDAAVGTGNNHCLPAGPLRAPLAPQASKADAIVLVGEGNQAVEALRVASSYGLTAHKAHIEPLFADSIEGERVIAFAGIGRPQKFFASVRMSGAELVEALPFPDHHPFTSEEADQILKTAELKDLMPVTTAKDFVRLKGHKDRTLQELASKSAVLDVFMQLDEPDDLIEEIEKALGRHHTGK